MDRPDTHARRGQAYADTRLSLEDAAAILAEHGHTAAWWSQAEEDALRRLYPAAAARHATIELAQMWPRLGFPPRGRSAISLHAIRMGLGRARNAT